ncbi:PAS domain-containing protein [Methylobacterium sp. 37f]|uniref:PAS domain-containing protein n=1 Tax=Methylobacterium sp. 37f TaxID=2817058 RepID=UPI001FFCE28E|nr:PAS domain-containing protein [Methylobacterium sp. 37f]MCK2057230.1 PAS domain-containing protein [Methylobacterium sp. 37f]
MFPIASNEEERLQALRALQIIGTEAEEHFDAVCQTASDLFGVPIALVSLLEEDRQWFKARCRLDVDGTAREIAFCTYAILSDEVLVVEDATADERFAENPLVTGAPHIRFYAGAPLSLDPGLRVGTLCIIDTKPRAFSLKQQQQLRNLAKTVVAHLRLHLSRHVNEAETQARQQAEHALLERVTASEAMFRAQRMAENAASIGHWRITPDDRRVTWSDGLGRIFGRPLPESGSFPLKQHLTYYHPDDRAGVGARIEASLAGIGPHASGYQGRARVMRPDGSLRHVLVQGAPDYDKFGALTALYGVILDITDLTASEEKAREASADLRTTLTHMDQGLIVFGPNERVRLLNPRVRELLAIPEAVLRETASFDDIRAFQQARGDFSQPSGDIDPPVEITGLRDLPHVLEWPSLNGGILEVLRVDLPDGGFLITCTDITRRRASEVAVQESERRYRLLAENATDIIVWCDLDTTRRYVSPAMDSVLGYEAEKLIGTRPLDYVHPEDAPAYQAVLDDLTRGKIDRALTRQRYRHRNGAWVWLENSFNLMRDAETGEPTGYVATLRDISTSKAVEDALHLSEERLALALDSGSDGLFDWNVGSGSAWFSECWYAMLGYARGELASDLSSWMRLAHPDDAERATAIMSRHLKAQTPAYECEFRLLRKDGTYTWVLVRGKVVSRTHEGRALRMVGTQIDISARKRAELALAESEARYRALSDALPQMVWVMRPEDGRATYTNQQFQTYYGSAGVTRQERLDHNHPDDAERMERTWRSALAQGGTFEVEGRLRRHDGAYRWHKLMMLPISQHEGILGWIGTALDIHDSVEARHKLEETADFLRLAQEAAGAAIWEWSLPTGLVRYPPQSARMLGLVVPDGLDEDDVIEVSIDDWKALVHPQGVEAVRVGVEEAVAARSTYASEFQLLSDGADGSERWLLGFGRVVFDATTGEATRIVGLNLDISERKRTEQQLAHLSRHDTLTDLPNRALFRERFEQKLAEVRREGEKLALFCLDLDRFKQVNDTLGHPAGDALLVEVAKRLKSALRTEDTLARLGGDEFVILQTGLHGLDDAAVLANRLIAAVGRPFLFEGHEITVGLSVGIALIPDHGFDQDGVFKCADVALYKAKAAGRNTYCVHDATPGVGMSTVQHLPRILQVHGSVSTSSRSLS